MWRKIIASFILTSFGLIGGALLRQPEINRLKKDIKELHKKLGDLENKLKTQDNQIRELKIRYLTLKGWHFLQKYKERKYMRGCIMYEYALKEYISILKTVERAEEVNMDKKETMFYNAFDRILNEGIMKDKDRSIVMNYILEKYKDNLNDFQEPDLSDIMHDIDEVFNNGKKDYA